MLSCLDFWRGGRNGIIAPILKIGGGDEPSIGSYPVLSAILYPYSWLAPTDLGTIYFDPKNDYCFKVQAEKISYVKEHYANCIFMTKD